MALSSATALLGEVPEEYERFRESRYSEAIALPAEGLSWRVDGAIWTLETGSVSVSEPSKDGAVTGLVFEGQGRFELAVPDRRELRQLRRFTRLPGLIGLDERFSTLVMRFTDLLANESGLGEVDDLVAEGSVYSKLGRAFERHRLWRRFEGQDVDARVLAGLLIEGDRYLRADMKTANFDWLSYEYDGLRPEEIVVSKLLPKQPFLESWLSLDRERDQSGRPTSAWRDPTAKLVHFRAQVDARKPGKSASIGVGAVNPVHARFVTSAVFESKQDGLGALLLGLMPPAEVKSISEAEADAEAEGAELRFARSHLRDRFYDSSLLVVLPRVLARGERIELEFRYEAEIPNYAPLLSWYPRPREAGFDERHTMRLEVTHRKDYAVKSVGKLLEETSTDGGRLTVFEAAEPLHGAGFTLARLPHQRSYEYEGLPEIVMFGSRGGYLSADKIESYSADIINAVNYFQQLFDSPVQSPQLRVTLIAAGHGQAMEGMLHISDSIAAASGRAIGGFREAFLAHEVAHEWWGHQVAWSSYRDQWLSEGFAQYSAMMFVQASLEDGPRLFREALEAYTNELTGSIGSAFGAFSRPGLALMNKAAMGRAGPIGHGYRAGVAEAPAAYQSMAYSKGALVLHMLRTILSAMTGSDDAFVGVLRDFVARHLGGSASTADFQRVLTERVPADWGWFFDQWVYSTHIPTYHWSYDVKRCGDGTWDLELEVEQTNVPPGFRSPIPLRAEFARDKSGQLLVMMDRPSKTFSLSLPDKPKKVILNPDHGILAKMRRR